MDEIAQAPETGPKLVIRSHPRTALHRPSPGHPEAPSRIDQVAAALQNTENPPWLFESPAPLAPDDDTLGVLTWVHDRTYIEKFRAAAGGGEWPQDGDNMVSEGSFSAALASAAMALQAGLDLANDSLRRAFLLTRPPSRHAERDRARGYCFFNNVALAAEVVVRAWNRPVLIVDFGAFHGNGIQKHFYARGDVGYVSVHEYPAFPGSGSADEVGKREGIGLTRNVPLAAQSGDDIICGALESAVEEVGSQLQPAAIVIAAGFDGHRDDPVGHMAMTAEGYARMSRFLVQAADLWAEGRILSLLEGGFEPGALAESAVVHAVELSRNCGNDRN